LKVILTVHTAQISNESFEREEKFKYLGTNQMNHIPFMKKLRAG
jgi:hypothetical protein